MRVLNAPAFSVQYHQSLSLRSVRSVDAGRELLTCPSAPTSPRS
jgi:hypothetical protein